MVTMREVANLAGVSVATVSFVVNDSKPVSAATRERVEAAMDQLGFRRNVLARALASQRTRIIAIVFPASQHRLGATALSIITSAAVAAGERGHNIVLWPAGYDDGKLEEYVRGGLVDGVLLMEVRDGDPRIPVLQKLGVPFGLIGRTERDESHPYVDIDFEQAVIDGIAHLTGEGHQHLGLVIGEAGDDAYGGYGPILRTREAYERRMQELGLEAVVVESSHNPIGGLAAADALASEHPDVTGVLVLNEAALFGFLSGIVRHGYAVPHDISILGLATSADNVAIADPVLSTLVAPGSEVGQIAVSAIIDALEDPTGEPSRTLVRCSLQLAGSTAPPQPGRARSSSARPSRPARPSTAEEGSTHEVH
ncbi:LacI family transcriptional regulator [Pseudoclavibacter sp. AY1F1]|uniref:LacI family DNA-binding transcriptional regulator n=1 Tax=Pseudoclavibacter sp. AY1F1 TaxID=2080583 RepID=UPI000CE86F51|nr:LacI family DNA-binding transcriptional regulator [Pseudoclavibacter sp. AY1F1]PPF46867.1 LacI family transcriptional regulator [Pseudoclavibacter sp. AY1F1]